MAEGEQQTADGGQWTVDGGQRTVDSGRWTVDGGQWTADSWVDGRQLGSRQTSRQMTDSWGDGGWLGEQRTADTRHYKIFPIGTSKESFIYRNAGSTMTEAGLVGLSLRIRNKRADDVALIFADPTFKVDTAFV